MFKLFKNAIKVTNDNLILATPLILFMWIFSIYIGLSSRSIYSVGLLVLTCVTVLLMTVAFMSGWFYMVKKAIVLSKQNFISDNEKARATFDLLKTIPTGIGKYALPILGLIVVFLLIISVCSVCVFQTGMHFIGKLDLDPMQIKGLLAYTLDMKSFLNSLTLEQLMKLNSWNLLILAVTSTLSFLLMFWLPELMYGNKNSLKALFISVKNIFLNVWDAFRLFLFVTVLNFALSLLSTISMLNSILYFVMLLVYFYFIVYLVVLIFLYYGDKFAQQK